MFLITKVSGQIGPEGWTTSLGATWQSFGGIGVGAPKKANLEEPMMSTPQNESSPSESPFPNMADVPMRRLRMKFTPTRDSSDLQTAIGSNELGSLFSFMARRYYAESVYPEAVKNIDIWNDKYFFGKIDEFGNAIYPSETNLRQIIAPDTRESIFAVDFVAKMPSLTYKVHLRMQLCRGKYQQTQFTTC